MQNLKAILPHQQTMPTMPSLCRMLSPQVSQRYTLASDGGVCSRNLGKIWKMLRGKFFHPHLPTPGNSLPVFGAYTSGGRGIKFWTAGSHPPPPTLPPKCLVARKGGVIISPWSKFCPRSMARECSYTAARLAAPGHHRGQKKHIIFFN